MGASASASKRSPISILYKGGQENKILVLGCMGSGKSTLCRLLIKMARGPQPVLSYYQHTIQNNVLENWKAILVMALNMKIPFPGGEEILSVLNDFRHREALNDKILNALHRISSMGIYQSILAKEKRPELPYNHAYFVENSERILQKTYSPTETDLLYMYSMTMGVDTSTVRMNTRKFVLHELPGHHIFRRKWTDFFKNTDVVVFTVDLSELCHQAFYDGHLKNKTVTIFKELLNNEVLRRASFIILFNKKDLFDQMSQGYDFEQLAPRMRSGQEALSFYRNHFLHLSPVKKVYNHVVSLTRNPNLSHTIVESLSTILKNNKENMQPE